MGQSRRLARGERAGMGSSVVVFAFRVLGAAVFAEPSVPEIEEVVGLVHKKGAWPESEGRVRFGEFASSSSDPAALFSYLRIIPRLASGPSVSRTGTVVRLPFRTTSTRTVSPT